MNLFPYTNIQIDEGRLTKLDGRVKDIYRTIIFNRDHTADQLLESFINQSNSLTQLLSIKNAQMEAQNADEAERYLKDLNHAIDFVLQELRDNVDFGKLTQFFQLFRIISPETHRMHPNRFRERLVQVGSYMCPEPAMINALMDELFAAIQRIQHPVVRAIYFHHEAIRIHPFIDANGRTVRIAKNWMLMHALYPPIFIRDDSEKKEYIGTLSASFEALMHDPEHWGDALDQFFNQELDRLIDSTESILQQLH